MMALASTAQAATPAAVDQYIAQQPSAGGNQGAGGGGGGGAQDTVGEQGAAGTLAESGDGAGGALPFTGYPMTPFLWIVLALLIGGLGVRLGVASYQRLGTTEPQSS